MFQNTTEIDNKQFVEENLPIYQENIQGDALKALLNQSFSPVLEGIGLKWRGDYFWVGENENGIRKVFHYSLLKGRGVLTWGVTLDFLPMVSENRLVYCRTEKSTKLHLFEWPKGYTCSFYGKEMLNGIGVASHRGKERTLKALKQAINGEIDGIQHWFEVASSMDGILKIAREQSEIAALEKLRKIPDSNMYMLHYPSPKYVLCFVLSKTGNVNEALNLFDSLSVDEIRTGITSEMRKKVRDKILNYK